MSTRSQDLSVCWQEKLQVSADAPAAVHESHDLRRQMHVVRKSQLILDALHASAMCWCCDDRRGRASQCRKAFPHESVLLKAGLQLKGH